MRLFDMDILLKRLASLSNKHFIPWVSLAEFSVELNFLTERDSVVHLAHRPKESYAIQYGCYVLLVMSYVDVNFVLKIEFSVLDFKTGEFVSFFEPQNSYHQLWFLIKNSKSSALSGIDGTLMLLSDEAFDELHYLTETLLSVLDTNLDISVPAKEPLPLGLNGFALKKKIPVGLSDSVISGNHNPFDNTDLLWTNQNGDGPRTSRNSDADDDNIRRSLLWIIGAVMLALVVFIVISLPYSGVG